MSGGEEEGASSPVLEYKTICSEHKRAVRSGLLFTILSNLHNIIAKKDFMRDLKRTRSLGRRYLRAVFDAMKLNKVFESAFAGFCAERGASASSVAVSLRLQTRR